MLHTTSSLGRDFVLSGATFDLAVSSRQQTPFESLLLMYMQHPYARIEASENPWIWILAVEFVWTNLGIWIESIFNKFNLKFSHAVFNRMGIDSSQSSFWIQSSCNNILDFVIIGHRSPRGSNKREETDKMFLFVAFRSLKLSSKFNLK